MGTSHKKTSSKNTRIFTFIIIVALKGKTIATNLSKAINTRLRVQTTCESALRYIPNLQTVEATQCTTYRDSWRQHSFADVQQPIEQRSEEVGESHVHDVVVCAGPQAGGLHTSGSNQLPISAVELITDRIDVNIIDAMAEHPGDVEFN